MSALGGEQHGQCSTVRSRPRTYRRPPPWRRVSGWRHIAIDQSAGGRASGERAHRSQVLSAFRRGRNHRAEARYRHGHRQRSHRTISAIGTDQIPRRGVAAHRFTDRATSVEQNGPASCPKASLRMVPRLLKSAGPPELFGNRQSVGDTPRSSDMQDGGAKIGLREWCELGRKLFRVSRPTGTAVAGEGFRSGRRQSPLSEEGLAAAFHSPRSGLLHELRPVLERTRIRPCPPGGPKDYLKLWPRDVTTRWPGVAQKCSGRASHRRGAGESRLSASQSLRWAAMAAGPPLPGAADWAAAVTNRSSQSEPLAPGVQTFDLGRW